MANDQPKIWCSMAWTSTLSIQPIVWSDLGKSQAQLDAMMEQIHAYMRGELVDPDRFPGPLAFQFHKLPEEKKRLPDVSLIGGGYLLISKKLTDLLREFDIGRTQMFPVTVHEYDQVTPRPEEYFALNIAESKDGFVPEQTTGPCELIGDRWTMMDWAVPAVNSPVADGLDLWVDKST